MNQIATLSRSSVERQLRDRIEELEEEVKQLKETLRPNITFPSEWSLRPSGARLLAALYVAPSGYVSRDLAFKYLAFSDDSTAEKDIVGSQVFYMRKRLGPFGIEIKTRWGLGFELPPASKVIVKAALEQRASA